VPKPVARSRSLIACRSMRYFVIVIYSRQYPLVTAPTCPIWDKLGALLLFDDLEQKQRPESELLRGLFGLTPASAGLLVEMASGDVTEIAAERLEIAVRTALNPLKLVYQKSGIHKQSEQVTLLNRLPFEG
jgi:DNA-binding CsgD family transcriptional regulator